MAIHNEDHKLGYVQIELDGEDIGSLGEDSAEVSFSQTTHKTTSMQAGGAPTKKFATMRSVSVKFRIVEATVRKFAMAFDLPVTTGGAGGDRVEFVAPLGKQITGKPLVVTRWIDGAVSTDEEDKLTVFEAVPADEQTVNFEFGLRQEGYDVVMEGLVPNDNVIAIIGDAT